MGLPDNRDIEPIRDDSINGYNNQPDFVMHQIEENERMDMDDESEIGENGGYSRLQTFDNGEEQPANDSDSSDSDNEDDDNEYVFNTEDTEDDIPIEPPSDLPSIISSENEIQAQVWNTPRRSQDTIDLNTEKTEQILKAMSKFSLPNVPQWASEVNPKELIERIKNKDTPVAAPSDKK